MSFLVAHPTFGVWLLGTLGFIIYEMVTQTDERNERRLQLVKNAGLPATPNLVHTITLIFAALWPVMVAVELWYLIYFKKEDDDDKS